MHEYFVVYKGEEYNSIVDALKKARLDEHIESIKSAVDQFRKEIESSGATVQINVVNDGHVTVDLLNFSDSLAESLQFSLKEIGLDVR